MSVDPLDTRSVRVRYVGRAASFQAQGQVVALAYTARDLTVKLAAGSFTWSLRDQRPFSTAFKTLQLKFVDGNMIEFSASYE